MTFGTSDRATREPRPPRRSRARTLVPLAVACWAALEIWLMTVVADHIGGGLVLLLLLAGFVLGGLAVKHAGRRAWNSLTAAMRSGAGAGPDAGIDPEKVTPAKGAGTAMLGGLLIMVPGFVSDAVGLLCLFPPTGRLLGAGASRVGRRLGRRSYSEGSLGGAFQQARMRMPDGKVVQGEVVKDDERDANHRPGDEGPPPPLER